jgi:hyperosmotically inducible periplasmic protein
MKNGFLTVGLILLLGIAGCTATKNTGTAVSEGTQAAASKTAEVVTDASITSAIKMKMANDKLVSASKIDVDTKDGNVTLNGTVKSQAEADKAVELANSVGGVKSVHSNLVVGQE